MRQPLIPKEKKVWLNIGFFAVTTLFGVIGAPLYVYKYGLSLSEVFLFLFFVYASGMGITVGYHRLFSHATYKATPFMRFLLLFFGAAAFEQSCLKWSSQHRDHHRFVDTNYDPYNIKKGFFYAHMGWLMFWDHPFEYGNVNDLQKDKLLMHQHKYYHYWAIGSGIVFPVLLGAMFGHAFGTFLISVCLRLTVVYHSTFLINSACHMFGKPTYDIHATAKDSWVVALLTFGEGYHNFHHKFPGDFRNGVRWYAFDPSKWVISIFSKLGFIFDLKKVSKFRILAARLAGENQRVHESLEEKREHQPRLEKTTEQLKSYYQNLRQYLDKWENAVREYQEILREKVTRQSLEIRNAALKKVGEAKRQFKEVHLKWGEMIHLNPLDLQKTLLSH